MDKLQLIKDFFEKDEEFPAKVLHIEELGQDMYEDELKDEEGKYMTQVGIIDGVGVLVLPE